MSRRSNRTRTWDFDPELPTENQSDWAVFTIRLDYLKAPASEIPVEYMRDFQLTDTPDGLTIPPDGWVKPLNANELSLLTSTKSVNQFTAEWASLVLPPEDYPVPAPAPLTIPPLIAEPARLAGLEPRRPKEEDFGVNVKGLLDIVLGAFRRADGRPAFEAALSKWRVEDGDLEEENEADELDLKHFEKLEHQWKGKEEQAKVKFDCVMQKWSEDEGAWKIRSGAIRNNLNKISEGYNKGEQDKATEYFKLCLHFSAYHSSFPRSVDVEFDNEAGVVLAEIQLPNVMEMEVYKMSRDKSVNISDRERKKLHQETLRLLPLPDGNDQMSA